MTVAPVGIRCPDHSGRTTSPVRLAQRRRTAVRRPTLDLHGPIVTKVLVAGMILVYLAQLGGGAGVNADSGWIFEQGALYGPLVADGDWWRLITAAFLHYGVLHIAMNMLALWWLGAPVEFVLGRVRFVLLFLVSGLAGSAGSLLLEPNAVTVGASGAIFGMLGAGLILEWRATGSLAGNYLTLIVVNLAFTFAFPGVSIGGHLGGLAGGVLGVLALSRLGRAHPAYDRLGLIGIGSVVGLGILSIAVAYWKVSGLA